MEKVELRYVNPYNKSCGGVRVQVGELYGRRGTVLALEMCDIACDRDCNYRGAEYVIGEEVRPPDDFSPELYGSEAWRKAAERVPTLGSTRVKPGDLTVREGRGK